MTSVKNCRNCGEKILPAWKTCNRCKEKKPKISKPCCGEMMYWKNKYLDAVEEKNTLQEKLDLAQERYAKLYLSFDMTLQRLSECKEACESLSKYS